MAARPLLFALALTACGPAAEPAPAAPKAPAAANPDAAVLGATPMDGAWTLLGDGATVAVGFGPPESEYALVIGCNSGTSRAHINWSYELAPDQDTQLRIITEAASVEFPARSFNEGLPFVNVDIDGADPRLAALAATQERFAVEVMGEADVLPWDQTIATALSGCGG
jgi:hypothetical protein